MAKKRASMREGPLAELLRSTEDSVDEAAISVSPNGGGVAVEETIVEEPEPAAPPEVEEEEIEVEAAPKPKHREVEPSEPRSEPDAYVADEPAVDTPSPAAPAHSERLRKHLISTADEPAFGRREPDLSHVSTMPLQHQAVLRVVGIGGGGINAVNRMVEAQIQGVEFVGINTDLQSLQISHADTTLHIGNELTRGLGSGADPRIGYRAAFEDQDRIKSLLKGSDMVFVTAGVGGGTGTGAAPVIAKLARDVGALTVAVVTKPFAFEGARRAAQAEEGIRALAAEVDTLIVVPNEKLLTILERRTTMVDAFRVADDVLRQAVQGISDLVMLPGVINLDFADVRTVMLDAGDAILGIGMGVGEHRSLLAAEKAVSSPLLDTSVTGARSLLLSVTGGPDMSLVEASEAAEIIKEAAHPDANIIFGANIDEDLEDQIWVTVIATRFDSAFAHRYKRNRSPRGGPWDHAPHDPHDARDPREPHVRDPRDRDRGDPLWDHRREPREPADPAMGGAGLDIDVPEFLPDH